MKTVLRNSGVRIIALFVAFTFAISATALANNDNGNNSASIELKFIGNYENQPVFQLNLVSAEEDEFTITIRDEYGYVLYSGKEKGTNITKKFMLKTEDFGDNPVTVEVKAKNTDKSQAFKIGRTHSIVENIVVNKVK